MFWRNFIILVAVASVCQGLVLDKIAGLLGKQKQPAGLPTDGEVMDLCKKMKNPKIGCKNSEGTLDDIINNMDKDACDQETPALSQKNITVTLDLNFQKACKEVKIACGDKQANLLQSTLGLVKCVLTNVGGVLNTVKKDVPGIGTGAGKSLGLTFSVTLLIVREALLKVIDILSSGTSVVVGLLCKVLPMLLLAVVIALPLGMAQSNVLVILTALGVVLSGIVGALTMVVGTAICIVGVPLGVVLGSLGKVLAPLVKLIVT